LHEFKKYTSSDNSSASDTANNLKDNLADKDVVNTFTFPDNGLVLLQGESGIGKTSILDGIHFVLYGVGTDLKNFFSNKCSVEFSKTVNGKRVVYTKKELITKL
jgi:ABC-type lipoprotein export system ATPase subunit